MPPFDPEYPTPENSLNRVPLVDLPGYPLPEHLKGKVTYQRVSAFALDALINEAGLLPGRTAPQIVRREFYHRLEVNDPAAESIAQEMGGRFGLLLWALKCGDDVSRGAREEWSDSHWDYWTSVQHVIIGGGIVTGRMGHIMAEQAAQIVQTAASDFRIEVAEYPQHLPLLGAARYGQSDDIACVFDFGGSFVKRGRAIYRNGQLQVLEVLPPIPVQWREDDSPAYILGQMVNVIVAACKGDYPAALIPISIASYMDRDGKPLLSQGGIYMTLRHLSDDIPGLLAEYLSKGLGRAVTVRLLHDGTSAASFYSPLPNAAVIMIGTALGVGFPVKRSYLCPVAETFEVMEI